MVPRVHCRTPEDSLGLRAVGPDFRAKLAQFAQFAIPLSLPRPLAASASVQNLMPSLRRPRERERVSIFDTRSYTAPRHQTKTCVFFSVFVSGFDRFGWKCQADIRST